MIKFVIYASYFTRWNPKTGKKVQIPSKSLPFFKCGKELRERVDYLKMEIPLYELD